MVDKAFDDFFDSDDDEFFLEASNHILDSELISDSSVLRDENASQKQFNICTLKPDDGCASTNTEIKTSSSNICKSSSNKCEGIVDDITTTLEPSIESNLDIFSDSNKISTDKCKSAVKNISTKFEVSTESNLNTISYSPEKSLKVSESNFVKGNAVFASTSKECESFDSFYLNNASITPVVSNKLSVNSPASYVNSRFTPGFTPKAKKRKLPGPAGLLEMYEGSKEKEATNTQHLLTMDMEFENIVSSQFTPEHLSLSSWKKLQTAVSSCPNLHSTVKHYSIQRVLQESSKKKLPKHMVVPALCVLLKKPSHKGSATIAVFMDDTGEINGKIDTKVISAYKDYLVEGTALILKSVTFLCNVLILKTQNVVSLYHPGGTEKHLQSLDSILATSEPLKPMNCECLKQSHHSIQNSSFKKTNNNTPETHKLGCTNHSQNRFSNNSNQIKTAQKISHFNSTPPNCKFGSPSSSQIKANSILNQGKSGSRNVENVNLKENSGNETFDKSQNMRSDAFLESLLDEDNCLDEFDELLGNLDEKSLMEDM